MTVFEANRAISLEDPFAESELMRSTSEGGGHPHVIRLLEEFTFNDREYADFEARDPKHAECYYVALEFAADGGLLAYLDQMNLAAEEAVLKRGRPKSEAKRGLPEAEARLLFAQLLSGLHYLHECGIAHLDLKPDNLLLDTNRRRLKITDLGMAFVVAENVRQKAVEAHVHEELTKVVGDFDSLPEMLLLEFRFRQQKTREAFARIHHRRLAVATPQRMSGQRPGTLRYMPPEIHDDCSAKGGGSQDDDDDEKDKWDPFLADVWGAGVVLFILLFGFPPFELPTSSDGRFKYMMDGQSLWVCVLSRCCVVCSELGLFCCNRENGRVAAALGASERCHTTRAQSAEAHADTQRPASVAARGHGRSVGA